MGYRKLAVALLIAVWLALPTLAQGNAPVITPDNAGQIDRLAVWRGHDDRVNAVAFSPDGRWLVSAGDDAAVIVWNAETGAQVTSMFEHFSFVKSIAFNPQDATRMATSSWDYTVIVWDINANGTISPVGSIQGFPAVVEPVVYSPDGERLAFGVGDGNVYVVDAVSGREILRYRVDALQITALAFSADGEQIVLAGGFPLDTAEVVDIESGEPLRTLTGHGGVVTALATSPDGSLIATGGDDATVRLWDATTGRSRQLLAQDDWVTTLAFNPDSTILAVGLLDGAVWLWDVENGSELAMLTSHTEPVRAVAWSPDGTRLASAGEDRVIYLWGVAP